MVGKGQQGTETFLNEIGQIIGCQINRTPGSPAHQEVVWAVAVKAGIKMLQIGTRQHGRYIQENLPFSKEE